MDMDLEPEPIGTATSAVHHQLPNANPSQVDIDSELRELLGSSGGGGEGGESDAASGIEGMLMD